MSKLRKYVKYFSVQALKQEFVVKRQYSLETVAIAVVWAARKAAKFQPVWHKEGFKALFGIEDPEQNEELFACFDKLYSAFDSSHIVMSNQKKPICIQIYFSETPKKSCGTVREEDQDDFTLDGHDHPDSPVISLKAIESKNADNQNLRVKTTDEGLSTG